jgi:beta-glucosidase
MNINTKKKSKNFCTAISSILFCVVMSFGLGSQVDKKDRGLLDEVHNVSPNITETLSRVTGTKSGVLNANGKFYADYATLDEAKAKAKELAIQIAAEGDVLLKNANGALPLRSEEKNITLLGLRTVDLVRSGFGSGAGGGSSPTEAATLLSSMTDAGFAVNPKPLTLYIAQRALMTDGFQREISIDKYSSSIIATYAGYNDAAILTFSRTGQENLDCATNRVAGHADENEHYLQLDDNERDLIRHAKKYFNKIIVLVNSSNIMQIPDLAEEKTATNLGVDAILWVGSVGANGVSAIGQILKGSICPSGHTVDLWEKDFTKAPTWTNFGTQMQNKDTNGNRLDPFLYNQQGKALNYANVEYREGIYSGYRYYETLYADAIGAAAKAAAYENVLYPFGYGLAYTSFEWKLDNIAKTAKITAANQSITMRAWVKNTGSVAGKDVVQIFYRAPYTKGGIEKSATNLIGFAKTKLLQPGESDVVTVTFAAQEMASFDELDANSNGFKGYELEAGVYLISCLVSKICGYIPVQVTSQAYDREQLPQL